MKTILLSVLIAFGGYCSYPSINNLYHSQFTIVKQDQETKLCIGINKKNKQCGNSALSGSNYCRWHEPTRIRCNAIAKLTGWQCINSLDKGSEYCIVHKNQKHQ